MRGRMKYCERDFMDGIRRLLSRRERKIIDHPPFAHAAVLVPLFQKESECHLLFTKRTDLVRHHKGEISFPGGVVDQADAELETTALREADEEIGLKPRDVELIGLLDDVVTVSGFIVTPVVGVFRYPYSFQMSEVEIAELIEIPLSFLLDEECFAVRTIVQDGLERVVLSYQYGRYTIWGATATIVKQLLDLIRPQS
jgi:8-oxo-dGTP pyrophosphatase MutT (NUDIX family)